MLADINLNLGDEPVPIGQQLEESQRFKRVIQHMLLAIKVSDSSNSDDSISDSALHPQSLYPS